MEISAIDHSFESEKNRKAFLYTACICGLFLIIAIFYTWPLQIPPIPLVQDLIDVNLGNEHEGMGTVQPLVKGERAPDNQSTQSHQKASKAKETPSRNVQADENNDDKEAAPVVKNEKPKEDAKDINKTTVDKTPKKINPSEVINPMPAPRKPKLLYKGGNGNGGNGATEDNFSKNQGNKPGNGDAGDPNGKADAYGTNPGGKSSGAPRVIGNRKIVRYYAFTGDLDKATIYATVKVSPEGVGTFVGFARNSSTTAQVYANNIIQYLRSVQFDKAPQESIVTVQFDFKVN